MAFAILFLIKFLLRRRFYNECLSQGGGTKLVDLKLFVCLFIFM